jgi:hypothetical protein
MNIRDTDISTQTIQLMQDWYLWNKNQLSDKLFLSSCYKVEGYFFTRGHLQNRLTNYFPNLLDDDLFTAWLKSNLPECNSSSSIDHNYLFNFSRHDPLLQTSLIMKKKIRLKRRKKRRKELRKSTRLKLLDKDLDQELGGNALLKKNIQIPILCN